MANNVDLYKKAMKAGLLFNQKEEWSQAMRAFSIAIKEFPNQPAPYVGLAEACTALKQYDKALDCYKRAARYSDGNIEYINRVADMQERQGQLHAAGQTYLAAGEILMRRRDLEGAIANWERAIRLEPNLLTAHKRLAMIFQRQGDTRAAVREYLAIARILESRGDSKKALYMCQSALRLDPDNEDVLKAVELIQRGADYFEQDDEPELEELPEEPVYEEAVAQEEESELAQAVRQIATAFASELDSNKAKTKTPLSQSDPLVQARRTADNQLADEILRDEDDEEYGPSNGTMSKLQRDVYIGQAIDFQSRGQPDEAIASLEKAIEGGLTLPAGFFMLGLLYLETGDRNKAQATLQLAGRDETYSEAVLTALEQY